MASFSGMDPELDPELAELMALEEAERGEGEFVQANPEGADTDPELAELMSLMEAEEQRRSALGASNLQDDENDPELAELMRLLEQEQDGGA